MTVLEGTKNFDEDVMSEFLTGIIMNAIKKILTIFMGNDDTNKLLDLPEIEEAFAEMHKGITEILKQDVETYMKRRCENDATRTT